MATTTNESGSEFWIALAGACCPFGALAVGDGTHFFPNHDPRVSWTGLAGLFPFEKARSHDQIKEPMFGLRIVGDDPQRKDRRPRSLRRQARPGDRTGRQPKRTYLQGQKEGFCGRRYVEIADT